MVLIPKNATLADPLRAAGVVAPLLMAFTTVLRPVVTVLNDAANWVLHRLGIEPVEETAVRAAPVSLAALVRHSAEEGTSTSPPPACSPARSGWGHSPPSTS